MAVHVKKKAAVVDIWQSALEKWIEFLAIYVQTFHKFATDWARKSKDLPILLPHFIPSVLQMIHTKNHGSQVRL
jgi:hypothetical protein